MSDISPATPAAMGFNFPVVMPLTFAAASIDTEVTTLPLHKIYSQTE